MASINADPSSDDLQLPLLEADESSINIIQEQERDYFPPPTPPRTNLLVRVLRELGRPWCATVGTVVANTIQVIMAVAVFGLIYNPKSRASDDPSDDQCDSQVNTDIIIWVFISAIRLVLSTFVVWNRYHYVVQRGYDERSPVVKALTNFRSALEALHLVWFVVGNMWIFKAITEVQCQKRPEVWVMVGMIIIQYIQICLPCIVAIILVPIFCFCLPCFVRLLASLHDPMEGKGADQKVIDELPLMAYRGPRLDGGESSPACPICLGDFVIGDTVRLLPCKHQFHRGCVDQWLMVNATCPSCRAPIIPESGDDKESGDELGAAEEV